MRHRVVIIAWLLAAVSCGDAVRPPSDQVAEVQGDVRLSTGAPFSGATIAIRCGPEVTASAVAGADGHYAVIIVAPGEAVASTPNDVLLCRFGVPDLNAPRILVEDSVLFFPPGNHALRIVDLREP